MKNPYFSKVAKRSECILPILQYYGNIVESHILMTEIWKKIRKRYLNLRKEFYKVLSIHNRINYEALEFNEEAKDFISKNNKYQYLKLTIRINGSRSFMNFLKFFKQIHHPTKIHLHKLILSPLDERWLKSL